jgi:hypothetical protein
MDGPTGRRGSRRSAASRADAARPAARVATPTLRASRANALAAATRTPRTARPTVRRTARPADAPPPSARVEPAAGDPVRPVRGPGRRDSDGSTRGRGETPDEDREACGGAAAALVRVPTSGRSPAGVLTPACMRRDLSRATTLSRAAPSSRMVANNAKTSQSVGSTGRLVRRRSLAWGRTWVSSTSGARIGDPHRSDGAEASSSVGSMTPARAPAVETGSRADADGTSAPAVSQAPSITTAIPTLARLIAAPLRDVALSSPRRRLRSPCALPP